MPETYTHREMLERLVSFPTVSRDSNLPLIDFVEGYLHGHGVECRRVPDEEGRKACLYALVGPAEPGGVVLSAHTDVVPVDGQPWSTDPFSVTERDGRLYGRGTCDMKGFAAVSLTAVPKALGAGLKRPIQIALSYDEEVGMWGAKRLVPALAAGMPPASAVIVGEPTRMQVVTGHKGGLMLHTHVRGYEVHSSIVHTGVSAIMTGAKLITWLEEQMEANRRAAAETGDPLFDPPYTTLHVGVIEGGTARNIVSRDCVFSTDIRIIPGERSADWLARYEARVAEIEAAMKKVRPEAGITVEVRADLPGCRPEQDGAAEALARALTGDNAEHAVSYGTEAGLFQDGGFSTCVCGPGDIEQAHQPDEYLEIAQLEAGAAFMDRLIARLAA